MQPFAASPRSPLARTMPLLDERVVAAIALGMLSSMVLLAGSSLPPSVTVSELWVLNEDASLAVSGILVSLRTYETGTEIIVICDESGDPAVRVVCTTGPGPPPSSRISLGDLLEASGSCVFEDGVPSIYCRYADVRLIRESEEVLTVGLLSTAWYLFERDEISVRGESKLDPAGNLWLHDVACDCSILMVLGNGVDPHEGKVVAECMLVLDRGTMTIVLEVTRLTPTG